MSEFVTSNRALALALNAAGVPMYFRNEYTPELLAKMGFKLAVDAVKAGKEGVVNFYITRIARLDALIEIYNDQYNSPTDGNVILPDEMPLDERLIRTLCHYQKTRVAFGKALKNPVYAWEIHGGDFTAVRAFEAKEAAIRKKLKERPDLLPEEILTADELNFITTPHTVPITPAKVINATMGQEKRKHIGL